MSKRWCIINGDVALLSFWNLLWWILHCPEDEIYLFVLLRCGWFHLLESCPDEKLLVLAASGIQRPPYKYNTTIKMASMRTGKALRLALQQLDSIIQLKCHKWPTLQLSAVATSGKGCDLIVKVQKDMSTLRTIPFVIMRLYMERFCLAPPILQFSECADWN